VVKVTVKFLNIYKWWEKAFDGHNSSNSLIEQSNSIHLLWYQ